DSGDSSKKEISTTSTPQFQCPMLKPSNYSLWAIRMQIILEANGLWQMIEPNKKTQSDNKKDKTAIAFLYQALPEEQLLQITKHKPAKAIWDALKTRHIGEERVQQARLQTLKSDFKMLHMKEDETIDTFTGKLTTLVNKAASLEHTMKDETLVRKLSNVVPDRYLQIVASIEQYSDLSEMTLEEAIGRLKTYEERIKYKKGKQSNLVEEDLEPTLLMAILEDSNKEKHVKEVEEQKVSLHEEDVGYKETNIDSLWYLDNGASNHMTGVREHFKELDEKVSGKVRFEDGSYIEIKGKGSILIEGDDEKQRIISYVYYIPSLKSNLLSLGQFTKIGCKVVMEDDELRLYDMDNKIFMKVTRHRNRLYKANLRIGTPVCLIANLKDDTWLWHARLRHLNFESLRSMAQRDLVHGIPAIKHTTQVCDVCLIRKHSRAPFPKKAKARSTLPLDLVYGDLCGPITPPTPFGKKYIFLRSNHHGHTKEGDRQIQSSNKRKFKMSDLGLLAYYLGIEVTQTDGDISIKQSAYVNKILKEAEMLDCNETLIPMDPGTRLTKVTEGTMFNSTEYQSLIGCLRYMLHTIPDLSYYVGLLSRFMQEPREQHMKAIRQVLRYIKGTKDYGITYMHNEGNKIHGFNDSSYGVNTQEGKGTTEIIFYYGESPISWSTKKQATIALSSCESEFITATAAATQALWLKRLLNKLTHSQEEKVTIKVDNKSAIALMK
nr:zinc finger, CCHC-type [Tanacetum cinerariifolium]